MIGNAGRGTCVRDEIRVGVAPSFSRVAHGAPPYDSGYASFHYVWLFS